MREACRLPALTNRYIGIMNTLSGDLRRRFRGTHTHAHSHSHAHPEHHAERISHGDSPSFESCGDYSAKFCLSLSAD